MDREARDGASSSRRDNVWERQEGKEFYSADSRAWRKLGSFCLIRFIRGWKWSVGRTFLSAIRQAHILRRSRMPNPTPLEPPPRSWPWRPLLPPLMAVVICVIVGVGALAALGYPAGEVLEAVWSTVVWHRDAARRLV